VTAEPQAQEIPASKVSAILKHHGDNGRIWIDSHEARLAGLCEKWGLSRLGLVDGGLYCNLVYRCQKAGDAVVLKVGYPWPELMTEIRTLEVWQGRENCVSLLDSDPAEGAILMEAIDPGTTFRAEPVAVRQQEIPRLFSTVPMPCPDGVEMPAWHQWFVDSQEFYSGGDATVLRLLAQAREHLDDIWRRYDTGYLLHGDLHHENMLKTRDASWMVIDPKGVTGPRVMEYGRFMHNFLPDEGQGQQQVEEIVRNRADQLAEEFAAEELLAVGFIDLVLSCLWTINGTEELSEDKQELLTFWSSLVG
jgi:streptomycin 6-kinase